VSTAPEDTACRHFHGTTLLRVFFSFSCLQYNDNSILKLKSAKYVPFEDHYSQSGVSMPEAESQLVCRSGSRTQGVSRPISTKC
jgi:hypothetical protein